MYCTVDAMKGIENIQDYYFPSQQQVGRRQLLIIKKSSGSRAGAARPGFLKWCCCSALAPGAGSTEAGPSERWGAPSPVNAQGTS